MDAVTFAAGLEIVSDNNIPRPQPAKTTAKSPSNVELDAIELPDYGLVNPKSRNDIKITPVETQTPIGEGTSTPKTPNELEESRPPTPIEHNATGIVPSWSYPKMNKWRVLSACMQYFGNGMNDAAPGALIPYIEKWYNIGYAVVSLFWITNAVGFIVAAFSTDFICGRLGRAKSLMLSEAFMITAYIIITCPVPFPAVVVAYLVLGFGNALNLALNNVFCANLANSTIILGGVHGSYGVGGILGPIVATALVSNGVHWSYFYPIPITIRLLCMASTGWSFWNYEQEETSRLSTGVVNRHDVAQSGERSKWKTIIEGFKDRTTIIGALFIFAYQGTEVAESGWFISYLIEYRNADPAHVGYVTSGFWAGITLGRFTLTHVARRIGEKKFVFGMTVGVIAFQLLAWLIPNVIGDSVAVAIVGLLLGPIIPCVQTMFARLLPSTVQVFAMGFIFSAGSSGGAVVPFLTGLLSQVAGTYVLHPICIAFFVVMLGCWAGLPRLDKRTE